MSFNIVSSFGFRPMSPEGEPSDSNQSTTTERVDSLQPNITYPIPPFSWANRASSSNRRRQFSSEEPEELTYSKKPKVKSPWEGKTAEIADGILFLRDGMLPLSDRREGQEHVVFSLTTQGPFTPLEKTIPENTTVIFKQPHPILDPAKREWVQKQDIKIAEILEQLSKKYPRIAPEVYLKSSDIADPNNPKNSGFWLVEKIPHMVDKEILRNATSIDSLPPVYQKMLAFIRDCFKMLDNREPCLIDLKPDNLAYRDDDSFAIIDALPPEKDRWEQLDAIHHMANQWALGNKTIFNYLTEGLSEEARQKVVFKPA